MHYINLKAEGIVKVITTEDIRCKKISYVIVYFLTHK